MRKALRRLRIVCSRARFLCTIQVSLRGVQSLCLARLPLRHALSWLVPEPFQLPGILRESIALLLPFVARRSLRFVVQEVPVSGTQHGGLLRSLRIIAWVVLQDVVVLELHAWRQRALFQHLLLVLDAALVEVPCQPPLVALWISILASLEEEILRAHGVLLFELLRQSAFMSLAELVVLAVGVDRIHLRRHVVLLTPCQLEYRWVVLQLLRRGLFAPTRLHLLPSLLLVFDLLEKVIKRLADGAAALLEPGIRGTHIFVLMRTSSIVTTTSIPCRIFLAFSCTCKPIAKGHPTVRFLLSSYHFNVVAVFKR